MTNFAFPPRDGPPAASSNPYKPYPMELNLDLKLIFAILNGKVTAAIYRKLLKHFSEAGLTLTPEQWTVLLYLSEQDGVSQQQLCRATYKEKPAMSHLVDIMEENGLVKRRVNPDDRRSNLVHLTPRGHLIKSRAQKVAIHTLKEALRGLGEESLMITQDVLRQIFENTTTTPEQRSNRPHGGDAQK